jgi:hypothetical protein
MNYDGKTTIAKCIRGKKILNYIILSRAALLKYKENIW